MQVLYPNCAGIDVHKREIKVCLVWRDALGQRQQEVRTYGTMTQDLRDMRDWLREHGCQAAAMESTGVYWQPVFNLLEGEMEVLLVNPSHLQHVPGRKTDVKDCEWLAELLEHGLLRGSFIPPKEIRDLRDLTRYRRKLVQTRTAEVNRLQKVLEGANLKLASVASDVMGVSGRAILQELLAGQQDPQVLAELSKGRLRSKRDELAAALEGRFRPHHAGLLSRILGHIDFLEERIAEWDAKIEEMCRPYAEDLERLDTLPGVGQRAAQDLIGEIGVDMSPFPSHLHLCSWARMCPGNNESAGKRKSGRTGPGNRWLRAILVECGQAAGRTKGTYLAAQYRRFARKKGKKHAAVGVGHSLLEAAYFILRDKVSYQDLGPHHWEELHKTQVIRYHLKCLEGMGLHVQVQEVPETD
jgi:transposase